MYDYPDGKVAPPLVATLDAAGTATADIPLGADVYFWQVRFSATADATTVLWRPAEAPASGDTSPLAAATAYQVTLAKAGDVDVTSLYPANQRPDVVRVRATAGKCRVEVLRVVRQ